MKLMRQLFYIFSKRQRWQFAGLFLLQLIETCLDFFGVTLILPFVNILINAESLQTTGWYVAITHIFGSST